MILIEHAQDRGLDELLAGARARRGRDGTEGDERFARVQGPRHEFRCRAAIVHRAAEEPVASRVEPEDPLALDHSTIQGQGVLGFDPGSDRFFSSAVYNGGSAPEFMTGTLDAGEPLVTFSPVATPAGTSPGQKLVQSSVLSVLRQNHFTWVAVDRGGGAVFTRQPEPLFHAEGW